MNTGRLLLHPDPTPGGGNPPSADPPAALPPTVAQLQAKIDALEKQLKDDPDRADLKARLAKLEAALEKKGGETPAAPAPAPATKQDPPAAAPRRSFLSRHFPFRR